MKQTMLKAILVILLVPSVIMFVRFYMLGKMSKTGKAPGLVSGRLSACSEKPNCVNSENADDDTHSISPLRYPASMSKEPLPLIKGIIQEIGGEMTGEEREYISATFTSAIFGFVDDVECRHDSANHTIHLRSASRVGHSDLGVNRKRAALISRLFNEQVNTADYELSPLNRKPSGSS